MRLLIVGPLGGQLSAASRIAMDRGAKVVNAETLDVALASLRQGRLVLGEPGERRGSRFDPVGPDEWIGLDGYYTGEPLRVVRDAHGAVSHLDLASFRFTREPYDPARDIPGGVDEAGWH